jgi:hypothetical protein
MQGGRKEDIHQAVHFYNFFIVNALNVKVVTEQPLGIKLMVFWDVMLCSLVDSSLKMEIICSHKQQQFPSDTAPSSLKHYKFLSETAHLQVFQ